ncbi:hypothetical protein DM02DRAFT_327848 [Periconia macrospinosa]|uniref:Uncharacterized protein n=1 Tax=Periconia macrospinosa TaxID=97972 RepID=A0A2V1EAC9_9PLEO|nr:hypothetical protein DM02DRAFT_327848 [Periconia macrospinosa]
MMKCCGEGILVFVIVRICSFAHLFMFLTCWGAERMNRGSEWLCTCALNNGAGIWACDALIGQWILVRGYLPRHPSHLGCA